MSRIPDELKEETPTVVGLGPGDTVLGQYRVESFLGRGAMGEVWKALDTQLDRPVAIKVLPAVLAESGRARRALKEEAARAIDLAQENIARVYQFGEHAGVPVLVLEYVAGETLAARLDREGALPLEDAAPLVDGLAAAVDHAHAHGVVHRDIKPSNVLLREDGSPVLADFGIAAEVRDQATRQGGTGTVPSTGTLGYMSPEQLKGHPPAPAMDLYSLAATAFEMLSGDPPFFRGDPSAVQYQILNEPPPTLASLPPAARAALTRGLAKDPGARFPDARSFARALRGEVPEAPDALAPVRVAPAEAPPPPGSSRATGGWTPPFGPVVGGVLGGLVVLVVGLAALAGGAMERAGHPLVGPARVEHRHRTYDPGVGFVLEVGGASVLVLTRSDHPERRYTVAHEETAEERSFLQARLDVPGEETYFARESLALYDGDAGEAPGAHLRRGVVAFPLPGAAPRAFHAAPRPPRAGETVWVWDASGARHAATVHPEAKGLLRYELEDDVDLASIEGAPVTDREERLVGVHLVPTRYQESDGHPAALPAEHLSERLNQSLTGS